MAKVSTHKQRRTVWAEVKSGPLNGFTRGGKSRPDALRNLNRALGGEMDKMERRFIKLRNLQRHVDKLVDKAS